MTVPTGIVSGVRVTYRTADVDDLDAVAADDPEAVLSDLLAAPGVEEAFLLQTCNRVEAYVVADDPDTGRAALSGFLPEGSRRLAIETGHEESLRHLLRVAAGLESMVLGEDEILGQVREAYLRAHDAGALGDVLEDALTKAIHVGERARTETAINEGAVSIGSAAADLAARECDLGAAAGLVVGAGEAGRTAAKALADAGIDRLLVANRTESAARRVADSVSVAAAVGFEALSEYVADADVVVTATGSPDPVLDVATLADAGETLAIDIARPRDVSPAAASLDSCTVYDLDALESVTEETTQQRRDAAERVEAMIDREFDRLLEGYKRSRADAVIAGMYEGAERVKRREVETALSRLEAAGEVTDDQREVVESLADALVSRILAAPTESLRDAAAEDDWSTIHTALQLFDPEFDDGPPKAVEAMAGEDRSRAEDGE